MRNALVLPLLAAVGLSVAACSKEPDATADANVTADNGAEFDTLGDNISAVDEATTNDASPALDNGAAPLDGVDNVSNSATDLSTNSAE